MGLGVRGARTAFLCLWRLFVLLCGFWTTRSQTTGDGKSLYFWETGPWGRCMGSECGPGGSQSRAVWCAHMEGWTTLHTNCLQSTRPANQQSCFRVCDWHKDLYDWRRGPWNQCVPISLRTGAGRTGVCSQGEEGIQTREVNCVLKADESPADDAICEYFEPKSRQEQACLIPCPQNCVVTEFTPWTTCSKTCGLGLQNRIRSVVAPPLFGGLPCPNLTEFQMCSPRACEGREMVFNLRVGGWSECKLPSSSPTSPPESSGTPVRPVRQAQWRKGKERKGNRDPEMRELIKNKRNRNRLNRPEDDLWNIEVGYQSRQVVCVHRNGSMVSLSQCPHWSLPETYQSCLMPKDCVITEWGKWSPCSKTCSDPSVPQGMQSRSRQVLRLPAGGGIQCPQLEESQICEPIGDGVPPCSTYAWRSTEWSECRVDALLSQQDRRRGNQTGLCGGGVQNRKVYCVQASAELLNYINNNKDKQEDKSLNGQTPSVPPLLSVNFEISASQPVDNWLCTGSSPSTTRLCQIPCPMECELSPWGAWGPCTFENCDERVVKKGFKFRRRKITNYPTGGEGNCPHLVEAVPCDDPSCFNWQLLKLEECIPDDNMDCGEGTQNPKVRCVNSEGKEVERELCADVVYPAPVPCVVPCPKDCALSLWTTWSTCSQTCSSKTAEGKQMRTRAILAYNAGEVTTMVVAWITVLEGNVSKFPELYGGSSCPSILQEVRNCNEHPCIVYHWQTGPWGQCVADTTASNINASFSVDKSTCAMGMQTRKVICVKVNVGQVPPKKCPEAPRPQSVRPCLLPCKKDCIVTSFSEWTECPTSCEAGTNGQKSKQSRYRVVIQMPANGGQECPDVLYEEKDCKKPSVCPGYRWKTHKWRKCLLVSWSIRKDSKGAQENCGTGVQTRAISCRQLDGVVVDVVQCLKFTSSMPAVSQPCQLPCRDNCQLTNWSKFSSCTSDCVGVRTRRRALVGKSKKKDKCKNSQMYPLSETQYCPCDKYNAQPVGNWSDCILPEGRVESVLGIKVQGDVKECGQGYRYQAMVCYDQENRLVEASRCNSHGYLEEACIVPCPSDCKLSEWSNWSRCSKSCGSGVKVRSKWLREKPYNGGRPCPKLDHLNQVNVYEVVPCVSDCSQYIWVAEPWSVWKVSNVDLKENCGEGVQTRRVRCMLNSVDGPTDAVEDYLCDPEEMPLGTRESRLPCPEDCALSDWSTWSPCDLPCSGSGDRERTAFALRLPKEGEDCPVSMQTEPCLLNRNCFHYNYNITDWSTCQLSANAVCGIGVKTRMLDCVRSDSKSVDMKFCKELGLEKKWLMNASCMVECPINCQLSDWSAWSDCSQTCGLEGKMWRIRTVVQATQGDGRPCPFQMEQWKPCPVRPCYKWQYGPWSECRVEEVVCGVGLRFRNLSCFVSDGSSNGQSSIVEEELCAGLELAVDDDKNIVLEETCTLPCPGDCYLMEWSDWSSCQSVCVKGQRLDFSPVQVRSRAIFAQEPENIAQCPDQEWQSRPCTNGECYEYRWMGGPQLIWCERSDGINVTEGCPPALPPGLDPSCDPPCDKPQSFCSEDGLCMCEEGYTEVLTVEGKLEQCTPIPVLEIPTAGDKKADVKTSLAINPTLPTTTQPGRVGRTWYLQPFGPDGKLKTWVYGVAAGVFVLLVFIVSMIYLACSYSAIRRSLRKPDCGNGTVVWMAQVAHELT
ncbi:thrombospondin type-1 domain-containing protein 7A-like [Xyrauchen texanus]|uniref:thrombospondin type-1 domain-containing protein 7A-like n=1 Tax=Xyrauchen texanus TaxID=154827 RepID=UPI00224212DF|nr:thrombospondin type-1 domain-containing protein 7A-like [Xyrauchen texanus]